MYASARVNAVTELLMSNSPVVLCNRQTVIQYVSSEFYRIIFYVIFVCKLFVIWQFGISGAIIN